MGFTLKFGTLMASAGGFMAWNAWQMFFTTYRGLYISDFSSMTIEQTWHYTSKVQLICHTTVIFMIVLGCKIVPKGSEKKGSVSHMLVSKCLQTLFSMFTDPVNYTAMDNLYNAMTRTFQQNKSVQQQANLFFYFFFFSLLIAKVTDSFWSKSKRGQVSNLVGDQIVASTFNNLAWYNAIAMMNTIFSLMKLYFPVTLFNIWLEDLSLLMIFSVLIGYINYRVVGDNIQTEMGLHTNMLYVVILTFLATTLRSLIINTLQAFFGVPIPPLIYFISACMLTLSTCIFSNFLKKYINKYQDDSVEDLHDVLGEVLEAFDKYLFGWLVSQFWNKFILSVFAEHLNSDKERLIYAFSTTFMVSVYTVFVFKVKVYATLKAYKKKLRMGKGGKQAKDQVQHFQNIFAKLISDKDKDE